MCLGVEVKRECFCKCGGIYLNISGVKSYSSDKFDVRWNDIYECNKCKSKMDAVTYIVKYYLWKKNPARAKVNLDDYDRYLHVDSNAIKVISDEQFQFLLKEIKDEMEDVFEQQTLEGFELVNEVATGDLYYKKICEERDQESIMETELIDFDLTPISEEEILSMLRKEYIK